MNQVYDVYLTSRRIKRRNGIAADQVAWAAVPRGPLDPRIPPEHVTTHFGSFLADGPADAIRQAREHRATLERKGK